MLLTEIDHVAIAVRDLEAAIEYYAAAFGAEVHHREIVESDGVEEAADARGQGRIQAPDEHRLERARFGTGTGPDRGQVAHLKCVVAAGLEKQSERGPAGLLHGLVPARQAEGAQVRDALAGGFCDLKELTAVLAQKAIEHKYTVMIGRTHGIHAEPLSFGLKLALWVEEMKRNRQRLVLVERRGPRRVSPPPAPAAR